VHRKKVGSVAPRRAKSQKKDVEFQAGKRLPSSQKKGRTVDKLNRKITKRMRDPKWNTERTAEGRKCTKRQSGHRDVLLGKGSKPPRKKGKQKDFGGVHGEPVEVAHGKC